MSVSPSSIFRFNRVSQFTCDNKKCISRSQLCDGVIHCRDSSDESRAHCSYLRSGDKIALKSNRFRTYMNGGNCGSSSSCARLLPKSSSCGGSSMTGSEWSTCSNQVFTIWKKMGKHGEPIRFGDTVAIQIGKPGVNYWLSCNRADSKCYGTSCTNYNNCKWIHFKIFAWGRQGGCSGTISESCRGKTIDQGSQLYLAFLPKRGKWLTSAVGSVEAYPCPGQHLNQDRYKACTWERWILNIQ